MDVGASTVWRDAWICGQAVHTEHGESWPLSHFEARVLGCRPGALLGAAQLRGVALEAAAVLRSKRYRGGSSLSGRSESRNLSSYSDLNFSARMLAVARSRLFEIGQRYIRSGAELSSAMIIPIGPTHPLQLGGVLHFVHRGYAINTL
jgi:hypothetical protein